MTAGAASVPERRAGFIATIGITAWPSDRAVWTIDSTGRRYEGAAAINRTLEELGRWRYLAAPYRLAPIRRAEDRFYRWFSFARWGVTPACERPGAECVAEGM
jgi:predicted DCC family thiol-disulfide oxidoreductase YuxK